MEIDFLMDLIKREDEYIHDYKNKGYDFFGWEYYEFGLTKADIKALETMGFVTIALKSNKHTYYKLNRDKINEYIKLQNEPISVPDDLFDDIVGHDNIKQILLNAIKKFIKEQKNYGFIFYGPPASAKTMFLDDFLKLPLSRYIVGISTTNVGLRDILLTESPKFIAIDEIDKTSPEDYALLLTLLDKGIVQKNVAGTTIEKRLNCIVLMAGNSIKRIPDALLSRSVVVEFKPYTIEELIEIGLNVLVKREKIDVEMAKFIVEKSIEAGVRDPRDFTKIARLCSNQQEVLNMLKTMKIRGV